MDGNISLDRKLRILVLEDSEEDAELMAREMRKDGLRFELKRTWTRTEFLCGLGEFQPDLIISDYTIPSYDGLAALDDVRKITQDVPFIFLSGTIGEEFALETLKRGATDYVLKDHLSRLVPTIRRAMQEYEERRVRFAAEESLRESEEKFKGLAASARDAIIMIDGEGKISYWNDSAERIFGYSAGEVAGREMHALLAPRRFRDDYCRGFQHFTETGQGALVGKLLDLVAVKKDGTEFPVEFSVSALQFKGEWHAISILRDITERKRAEEAIRWQLDHMTALRDIELAINSSLDLRTTLSVLLDKLTSLLDVDAADVLLLDKDSLYLNYAAGRGFRTPEIQNTHVRLGKDGPARSPTSGGH